MNPVPQTQACILCGFAYDVATLGRYGCPNCLGEGLDDGPGITLADVFPRPLSIYSVEGEPPVQGPPEEIGTGLYRLADGEVVGGEPEDLTGY